MPVGAQEQATASQPNDRAAHQAEDLLAEAKALSEKETQVSGREKAQVQTARLLGNGLLNQRYEHSRLSSFIKSCLTNTKTVLKSTMRFCFSACLSEKMSASA